MQTQYLTYRKLLAPVSGSGISEAEAKDILRQILPYLSELHDRDQTHGSISLDTVAYDYSRMEILLLDGNGANHPPYLAPESLETQQTTPRSDVYAIGVLIIVLLTGKPPEALRTSNNTWNWQKFCAVSDQFEQILNMALFDEPDGRYFNAGQMLQSIQSTINSSESRRTSLHNNPVTLSLPSINPQDSSSKQPLPSVPSSDETRSLELSSSESNYSYRPKRLKGNFHNSKIRRKAKTDQEPSNKVATKGRIKILTAMFLVLGATMSGAIGSYFYMQPQFAEITNKNLELANAVNPPIAEEIPRGNFIRATADQFVTQWQSAIQKRNDLISKVANISTFKNISTTSDGQSQVKEVTEESTPKLDNSEVVTSSPSAASSGLNVEPPRNLATEPYTPPVATYTPPVATYDPPVATYDPPVKIYNPPVAIYNSPPEESIPPAPRVAK